MIVSITTFSRRSLIRNRNRFFVHIHANLLNVHTGRSIFEPTSNQRRNLRSRSLTVTLIPASSVSLLLWVSSSPFVGCQSQQPFTFGQDCSGPDT
jgi:hypothetical protein